MSSTTETTQTETSSTTVPETVSTNTERILGLVKWFQGGFGFVTNFNTKEDVFVHHSSVTTKVDCWKLLYSGEYVEFSIEKMEDGKSQATNVTGVRVGPIRCETLALLRQERDEYNHDNRTEDQESSSTRNASGRTRGGQGQSRGRGRGRGYRSSGTNTSS